jgi:diguanylate cyclase (GGDEF)-like protein
MARILVVDDVAEARTFLRTTLEYAGHVVDESGDGAAALEFLSASDVDLVISDGLMPVMDGFRLCLEIRRRAELAATPFILYTASFTQPDDERLAKTMGADVYLRKPAEPQVIIETVGLLLSSAEDRPPADLDAEPVLLSVFEQYSSRIENALDSKVAELHDAESTRDSYRALLNNLPLMIVTIDPNLEPDFFSRVALEFIETLGIRPNSVGDWLECVGPDVLQSVEATLRSTFADLRRRETTVHVRLKDGRTRRIRLSFVPYYDSGDALLGVVIAGLDVTEEEEHAELLLFLADHDTLTGLPNRRVLNARFEELLGELHDGRTFALLFIDIDRFKTLNDTFGHDVGDVVLSSVARLIRETARDQDLVVRLCGDEFVVLAEGADESAAADLLEAICDVVSGARIVPGAPDYRVTVSIGVQLLPESVSPDAALRAADDAMYRAEGDATAIACVGA